MARSGGEKTVTFVGAILRQSHHQGISVDASVGVIPVAPTSLGAIGRAAHVGLNTPCREVVFPEPHIEP